jgi:hypothetical protein
MMLRDVVGAVHRLSVERRRVPAEVLFEAKRLECLLFLGYDPHFDGDWADHMRHFARFATSRRFGTR